MPAPDRSAAPVLLLPGLTVCADCRNHPAILTWDAGETWATPLCADCTDQRIDREQAATINRDAVNLIQQARRETTRPLPRPPARFGPDEQRELKAFQRRYRAALRAELGQLAPALDDRCVAIVAAGDGRCRRRAESTQGWKLCDTHTIMGCRLPGLGWKDGSPVGRIIQRPGRKAA